MRVKLSIGEIKCRDNRNSAKLSLASQVSPDPNYLNYCLSKLEGPNLIIRHHWKLLRNRRKTVRSAADIKIIKSERERVDLNLTFT